MASKEIPEVLRSSVFSVQVCVPAHWSDRQIVEFAENELPSGTSGGWFIRTDERLLEGDPVRNQCEEKPGFVHVMLDA